MFCGRRAVCDKDDWDVGKEVGAILDEEFQRDIGRRDHYVNFAVGILLF